MSWPSGTEISVIGVKDPSVPLALGSLNPQVTEWIGETDEGDHHWVLKMVEASADNLRVAGPVTTIVEEGDAKRVLVDEAKRLGIDYIFGIFGWPIGEKVGPRHPERCSDFFHK